MEHPYRSSPAALEPPPRQVPFWLAARLLLDGPVRRIGWLWLAGTMAVFCWFAPRVHLTPLSYPERAPGRVAEISEHDDDDRPMYDVEASFVDREGHIRYATSSTRVRPHEGEPVEVDYDRDRARIHGMDDGSVSLRGAAIFLLLLGAGAFLVLRGLGASRRGLRLLRVGVLTSGRLVEKQAGTFTLNDTPESILTFEFELANGRKHRCTVHTFHPELLEDQPREAILYDPRWPDHATTLDHLPGSPRLDRDGRIHASGTAMLVATPPLVAAVLLIAGLVRLL